MYGRALRVRLNGIIGRDDTPVEAFSFGFMLTPNLVTVGGGQVSDAALAAQVADTDIRDACKAYFGRAETRISSICRLDEVAVSLVVDPGSLDDYGPPKLKQVGDTVRHAVVQRGAMNTPAVEVVPPQIALAVSLGTGARGPGARGRFYLPVPAIALDLATFLGDATYVGQVAASTRQLREDLKGDGYTMAVNSGKRGLQPVTTIRVGRALDTIRSRRRALPESYVTAAPLSS